MYIAISPDTEQQCTGNCFNGFQDEINVTQFGSVVIPCGNVVPSDNTRVNYCNRTSPLALGADVLYNLTGAQIHQNGNILYCAPSMQGRIICYRLNVFCKLCHLRFVDVFTFSTTNVQGFLPVLLLNKQEFII